MANCWFSGLLKMWKRLSIYMAYPALLYCVYTGFKLEFEHMAHWNQPEVKEYAHLQIRSRVSDGRLCIKK